jgi:NADPH:quinone reductase-like Zn-dependent oxidoreductase
MRGEWHLLTFEQKISGYYTPGTFQQYALAPANYVTPIPDGLDSAAAAPMLCAGVTVYSALRKANAEAGYVITPKNYLHSRLPSNHKKEIKSHTDKPLRKATS